MEKREHIYSFDWLRVIAGISVIFMHAAAGPLRGTIGANWHILNLFTSFCFTAVPLFFMMSGYLLLSSERTMDTSALLKKRLPRLGVPLIGWTVVAILWSMILSRDFSLVGLYEGLVKSLNTPAWVHLWYMYTLIVINLISPILRGGLQSLDKKGHILVLTLIGLVSLQAIGKAILPYRFGRLLNADVISQMALFNGHLCTFILGYYLGSLKKKISNALLAGGAIVLLAIIVLGTWWKTVQSGSYNAVFQNQSRGFEVLLAACIFLLFKQNVKRESRILKVIPFIPLSLAIYLMHNILLSMMLQVGFTTSNFPDVVLVTVVNLAICYLVMKTVATIKPICYLATGMTYRAACESCNWVYTIRRIRAAKK